MSRGLIAAAVLLLLAPHPSAGEDMRFGAERMEEREGVMSLRGSVWVEQEDARVDAGFVAYDTETGDVYAEDDVRYEDADVRISARRAELNLETKTGVLQDAELYVKADGYRIRSERMERIGEDRYLFGRIKATTCEGVPPPWCITSRRADLWIGERLVVKHATFRLRDVPLVYVPHLWIPIVTERRSGILNPTMGYRESTGFLYRQPVYWAMAVNRDATLALDYYTDQAFGEGVEYRYIETPRVRGFQSVYHLRDYNLDRDYWEGRGLHEYRGKASSAFLDLNLVNYREFYRRYEPFLQMSSRRFLESRAEVAARAGDVRLYAVGQYYQDLKDGEDQEAVLHRLPEVGAFMNPEDVGPVAVTAEASATQFEREKGAAGQRYSAGARATYAMGRAVSFTHTLAIEESLYELHETADDSFTNDVFDYRTFLQTSLTRYYGDTLHEVTPSVGYRWASRQGQPPPLLDARELVGDASVADISVLQRFSDEEGEFLTFRATQPYDFRGGERPFRPLLLELHASGVASFAVSVAQNVHDVHTDSANATLDFELPRTQVSAGLSYNRLPAVTLYKLEVGYRATDRLSLGARVWYDSASVDRGLRELAASMGYRSQCWGLELELVKRPEDYGVFMKVNLLGLGAYEIS